MKKDILEIINAGISAALPYESTLNILKNLSLPEKVYVMAIGKAAVPQARAAEDFLGKRIANGLLVTKYLHSKSFNSHIFTVIEAGHPISDNNSEKAAETALEIAESLTENDTLIVLLSGGGSALFEKSRVSSDMQREITKKLLSAGADIRSINAVRKRLSLVKGGRLSAAAYPAKVITIALSDVLSNDKGVIASGITVQDEETDDFVKNVIDTYLPDIDEYTKNLILTKDSLIINNGGYYFAGDINILCDAAGKKAEDLGYTVFHGRRNISGEARNEALEIINNIPKNSVKSCYIFGGETVVTLKGNGKGGRNQEMALACAIALNGKNGITFACVGSDGTDGPTDAAGGICDGRTYEEIKKSGVSPEIELYNNNSYYALKKADALVITGPTGTNVNDIIVVLTDNGYGKEN